MAGLYNHLLASLCPEAWQLTQYLSNKGFIVALVKATVVEVTVKLLAEAPVKPLTVTAIAPVLAVAGTVTDNEVAEATVTVAVTPLNLTVLLAGVVLKFVPVIITVMPAAPLVGEKLKIVGVLAVVVLTVKLLAELAVTLPTVTAIIPELAPEGTFTINEVAVAAETVATVPLNLTILLASVELKFVPVMVTVAPTAPLAGEKLVIVGSGTVTVKLVGEVVVKPPTVTSIAPVLAPTGTVTVKDVAVAAETVATTPLNLTVLLAEVALKFAPEIMIVVPTNPLMDDKLVIVGEGVTGGI